MKVQRLSSTDGFIVQDLDAATTSVGVVRLAPKVLRDGAVVLARSTTYAAAAFGLSGLGGASGAINARPEGRDQALAAFLDEVRPRAEAGDLVLTPSTGVTDADLAPVGWTAPDPALVAAGALAAARVAGPLDWRTAAVVGTGPEAEATTAQLQAAGATVTDPRFDSGCDVLFVAGKPGVLDHDTASTVQAGTIVPLTPAPVATRALAVLSRAERVVIPDFLSTAGPLLAAHDAAGGDPVDRIRAAVTDLAETGTKLWLTACERAEAHLATWTDESPFGRPLP